MELSKLQKAVAEWSSRNFGDDPAHGLRPLLGVAEEVGELALVALEGHVRTDSEMACAADLLYVQALLGRVFHHALKSMQNIRGHKAEDLERIALVADRLVFYMAAFLQEEGVGLPAPVAFRHDRAEQRADAVGDILIYLSDYCRRNGLDLNEALETTWAKVKQRNWKLNPETGGGHD